MRKLLIAIASIGVLIVGLVVFLLVHDFDSPDLGRALLDKVSAATGVTITARTFHLNLMKGLTLGGVEVTSNADGRTCHLKMDALVFEHQLGPLLSGTVAINKVLLDRPVIEIVELSSSDSGRNEPAPPPAPPPAKAPAPPPASATADEHARTLSFEMKELSIRDARVSITHARPSDGRLLLEGLTVNLRDVGLNPAARSLAGISGSGDISLEKATLNAMVLRDVRTNFQLADAAFSMPELAVTSEVGKLTRSDRQAEGRGGAETQDWKVIGCTGSN